VELNRLQRYVLEEHVEDFLDGFITRRELIRRATFITGSVAASLTLLEVMGCGSAAAPSPTPSARVAFATPPGQGDADGVTVRPDDKRITILTASVKGADGASLISYMAAPTALPGAPGVLVVHENRGLVEHIRDVVRRVATAGYVGLSIDLLSRDGGAARLSDPAAYAAALARRPAAEMVADLRAALDYMNSTVSIAHGKLGVTGFCFGGGMVWSTLASGASVKAAVPFYGPAPSDVSGLAGTRAAVLAVYAALDTRVTSTSPQVEAALKKSGAPYEIKVYPGVDHAFHNDTGPRYNAAQAQAAWGDTIAWFRKYLV